LHTEGGLKVGLRRFEVAKHQNCMPSVNGVL
jgi:hypothetical protein